jgi:hypothetical protein
MRTPHQEVRDATGDRLAPARWPCRPRPAQAGLVFRPLGLYTFKQEQQSECLGTIFSQRCGGFLNAPGELNLPASTAAIQCSASGDCQRGLTSDLASSKASAQGRALWRAAYIPGPRWAPVDNVHYLTCRVQHIPCTANSLACTYIYSAMYSAITSTVSVALLTTRPQFQLFFVSFYCQVEKFH